MKYASDDLVQTDDGKFHRVIYECKCGELLFVKTQGDKKRKAHKIKVSKIVLHAPRKKPC